MKSEQDKIEEIEPMNKSLPDYISQKVIRIHKFNFSDQITDKILDCSIIVPVYNAKERINELLDALREQETEYSFEVILVDDESQDDTVQAIINSLQQGLLKFPIRLIEAKHAGPAIARNIGAMLANSDIIIFTDSDCTPSRSWINSMRVPFENEKVGGVGGTYHTKNADSIISRYFGYDIEYRHSKYKENIDFIATYSAAYRKNLFINTGMFSSEFTEANAEDNDLSYRIYDSGALIKFAPEGIVGHRHPESIKNLFNQQMNRAIWRVKLYRRNKNHKSDDYTGLWTLIQPFIWSILVLYFSTFTIYHIFLSQYPSFLQILFHPSIILILIAITPLFFLGINFSLLFWIKTKKDESIWNVMRMFCFTIIRSFAWFIGGIIGFFRFIVKK